MKRCKCADLVEGLAYTGLRLAEAGNVLWVLSMNLSPSTAKRSKVQYA